MEHTKAYKEDKKKLNYSHVEYVINCLGKNTTKVRNIKSYLLASLFNAGSTISSYYRAEVNHDMPQFAGGSSNENTMCGWCKFCINH